MTRLPLLALVLSGVLVAGCTGGSKATPKATATTPPTTASTTSADGTTVPGAVLKQGQRAVVRWRAGKAHDSVIGLTVTGVRRGSIADLSQYKLGRAARASTLYYVYSVVRNTGSGNLSGRRLPLYGKVSSHLVVPPVRFKLPFHRCDDRPLPAHFAKGARARVCMVMLAPRHGSIS
ncbi:MAG: hypothetical protein QOK30_2155, partial [Nocardioidaceae bacterium]|nr:hypothetical protein [Nocardioidaceae bacterium]